MALTNSAFKAQRLGFWLPWLVAFVGVCLLAILLVLQVLSYQRDINTFVQQTAYEQLLSTQRQIETAIRRGDLSSLDTIVSELGLDRMIERAILLDDRGIVLAATNFAWKNRQILDVSPKFPYAKLTKTQTERYVEIKLSDDKRTLNIVVPVYLGLMKGSLDHSLLGMLYVKYDLTPRLSESLTVIKQQTLAFFIVTLLVSLFLLRFIRQQVLKPVKILKQGMQDIGEEKYQAFVNFSGKGEFAVLGAELERMAHQLETRSADLKTSEARFRQLTEASQEGIFFHDKGIVLDANSKMEEITGVPMKELIGQHLLDYVAPYHHAITKERMQRFSQGFWDVDALHANGQIIPCEISVAEQEIGGRMLRVVAMRDISSRLAAEEKIRQLSNFDPLTGLANRHFLMQRIALELENIEKHRHRTALAALNINGFKAINDSLGMAVGDQVLRQIAQRLSLKLVQGHILARVEGDTFSVLITQLASDIEEASKQASSIIEELLAEIEHPLFIKEQNLHLQAVAGIVIIPNDSNDPAELLREAETAMHQAKLQDEGRIHFFAHSLQQAASERLTLRNELRQALQLDEQIILHYQPQLSRIGELQGVEALVRWLHPTRGMVPPGEFIEEAESNGLIVPLGNKVLMQAVKSLKYWQQSDYFADFKDNFVIAVNVSPRQFREPDFVTRIEDALAETGVGAMHLELELTESVVANDLELTVHKMEQLRKHGVHFALDDFGTGYSSLSYLKHLPMDTLKIDRSFVMDIDAVETVAGGKRPAVLIDAIVAMAHQLGMQVLAEGVETSTQLAYLKTAGCDTFQGYYFSKPLAEADFIHWLQTVLPHIE